MFTVKINDSQVLEFTRKSPQRARWALREALGAAGARMRKEMVAHIYRRPGWPALAWGGRAPLAALATLLRYRVTASYAKNQIRAQVGFFWGKARGMTSVVYKKFKARFRASFDMSPAQLAKIHEEGKRIRVTPAMRRKMAALGHPLRKMTRFIQIPRRPIIQPVWDRNKASLPGYISKKFFSVFFSSKKPNISF